MQTAVSATNHSGLDLYRKIATGDGNLCLSPYSIESALAMTFAGADGATRTEMARVLHLPANGDEIHASFSALQKSLESLTAGNEIVRCRIEEDGDAGRTDHTAHREPSFRGTDLPLSAKLFGPNEK